MIVLEYEARFHKLSGYGTMILPIKEERVRCLVRGLRMQLSIETQSLVTTGQSFWILVIMVILLSYYVVRPMEQQQMGSL